MLKGLWDRIIAGRTGKESKLNPHEGDFVAKLNLSHSDGDLLELVLENLSEITVWVEDVSLLLTDVATCSHMALPAHAKHKHQIRQNIKPNDQLIVSLAEAIYDAAGRPQGRYSSLVLANVHYRAFSEWCTVQLETCRIEMDALTVIELHHSHWYNKQ